MSNRLNQEREKRLAPTRMEKAITEINKLGLKMLNSGNPDSILFLYEGSKITYYPYSGWATGKTIKDGRGLKPLLRQLKGVM